jgi:hypothetical protein
MDQSICQNQNDIQNSLIFQAKSIYSLTLMMHDIVVVAHYWYSEVKHGMPYQYFK